MNNSPRNYLPHFALLATQLCFGSLPVFGKVVLKTLPAFSVVGFRVGVTALVLFIFQRFVGSLKLEKRGDYWRFAALSLFGVTLNQIFFITGLSMTTASNSSLLAVTIPIFTLSFGAMLGVERLRPIKIFGIILAAIGVILLIDPTRASFSSETTLGDILIILNSLCYGIYVSVSKELISRNGALKSITWVFIFAAIICVPLGLFSLSSVEIATVSPIIWLMVGYIVIVSTTMPYFLNAWALARVNPSTVAVYIYLQPLIGFLLAVIFLKENLSAWTILAGLLIFSGVYIVTKRKKLESLETAV